MFLIFKKLSFIFSLSVAFKAYSYSSSDDSYYNKLSNQSPALFVKNSIQYLNKATSENDKLSILYYTARSCYKIKDNARAISCLVSLENRLQKSSDPVQCAKLYGKMAYLYNYLNYFWKSKAMLEKSNKSSLKPSSDKDKYEARAYYYVSKAIISSTNSNFEQAKYYYSLADAEFNNLSKLNPSENPELGYTIAVNLGDVYIYLKNLDKALYYNLLAIRRSDNPAYLGEAYLNIGKIYSTKQKLDSALFYYKKSISNLRYENSIEGLNESFDSIRSIYIKKNRKEDADRYYVMQMSILDQLEDMDESSIGTIINENIFNKNLSLSTFFIFFGIIGTVLVLVPFYIYIIKIEHKKFKRLKRLKNTGIVTQEDAALLITEKQEMSHLEKEKEKKHHRENPAHKIIVNHNVISNEDINYQQQIMESLREYEKTFFYLNSNITLAQVAVKLNVNTRTLSESINKNKKVNFNSYINILRINYVVSLLENDPKYRNYKIVYLASVCGFSSHSTFTKIFKSIKGISPSEFIDIVKVQSEHKN